MISAKVLRNVLIPAATLIADKSKANSCCCRPSELPIYSSDPPPVCTSTICEDPPTIVEQKFQEAFGVARKSVGQLMSGVKELEMMTEDFVSENLEVAMCYLEFLREDDNTTPKYGAIAIGGLTGLIFGLRGGIIKKTLYTSAGALGMAAVCYPKEANEYSQMLYELAIEYITIGYNFLYGVKKGDPPLQLPSLSNLSTNITDAWNSAKSLVKPSSTSTVADKVEEDVQQSQVKAGDQAGEINPLGVVTDAHDTAQSKSCHCPIGACLGHHEEASS